MGFARTCYRCLATPLYTAVKRDLAFTYFYPSGGEWWMRTRGVTVPIKDPRLAALHYYRYFVPKAGGIVFDVGGESGLEARQFSGLVGGEGRVFTFECFPEHVATLRSLAATHPNVEVVPRACWNRPCDLDLLIGNTSGSHTMIPGARGHLGQALAGPESVPLTVQADTLDNLWRELTGGAEIELLKMDIEGAEYEALEGAGELLRATRLAVVAAYHVRDDQVTAPRVASMLEAAGFETRVDENHHVYGRRSERT